MYEVFENLMKRNGYKNATQISNLTGIPRSMFTDWKKGRSTPKADKLKVLADFFGEDISVFLDGKQAETPGKAYYTNETYEIAQKIFDNKELRLLLDEASDADPDDVMTAYQMLLALKRKERKHDR